MDPSLIPKSIRVKGAKYKILWLDDLRTEAGEVAYGICNGPERKIALNSGLLHKDAPKDFALKTLLHELFHGVNEEIGLNQSHVDDSILEIICESYASWLVDTFDLKLKK